MEKILETPLTCRRFPGGARVRVKPVKAQGALVPATSAAVARASATPVRLLANPACCPGRSLLLSYTDDANLGWFKRILEQPVSGRSR